MQIRIIAFLLFIQSFVACQQGQGNLSLSEAQIVAPSIANSEQDSVKAKPTDTNIIFQSADGGQTWQDVSAGLPKGLSVEGVYTSGGEVILGCGNGLYRSNSALVTPKWQKEIFVHGRVTDVFPGRTGLFACSYGNGLYQNIAGTEIWTIMGTTMENTLLRKVVETPDGAILVGSDNGIYKSADAGKTWKHVFAGGMVLNLVVSGDVLIGGGLQGILRSTDGGENWENVLNENILAKNTGLIGDRLVTIFGTEDPLKVSPDGVTSRMRVSADGGKTWQRMEQTILPVNGAYKMDERLSDVKDVYSMVQSGEYLICSFDTGIFRSADQGKTWEPVFSLKGKGRFNLAVSGKMIYAVPGGGC